MGKFEVRWYEYGDPKQKVLGPYTFEMALYWARSLSKDPSVSGISVQEV